jgi:hypothetical protein
MTEVFSAKTLLHKIIDLTCSWSVGNIDLREDNWQLEKSINCLPRYFRIKEINALSKAFGVYKEDFEIDKLIKNIKDDETKKNLQSQLEKKSNLQFILDGDFINEFYSLDNYPDILKIVNKFHKEFRPIIKEIEEDKMDVVRIYKPLLTFRQRIQKEIGGFGILLEGKALEASFVTHLKSSIDLDFIDEILANFIDKEKRIYSRNELISNYNYPDIDLKKIDYDYYMDSFEDY